MGGAGQLQAAPARIPTTEVFGGHRRSSFRQMFLVKRFKCLLVAFLLLSASPTTLSHCQEYQSTNGANQRAPMCIACCTITLVAMILIVCFWSLTRMQPLKLGSLPVVACVSSSDIYYYYYYYYYYYCFTAYSKLEHKQE